VSPAEPFLIDRANAGLAGRRGDTACSPRPIGLWTVLRLADEDSGGYLFFALLCGVSVLLAPFALMFLALWLRAARREYRLHRRGRVLAGKVVSFEEVTVTGYQPTSDATAQFLTSWAVPVVRFSFPTPDGRVLSGGAPVCRRRSSEMPPRPGQPVAVLYLDDGNYRVL
jgi:hypothetical protein